MTTLPSEVVNELHSNALASKRTAEQIDETKKKIENIKQKIDRLTAENSESSQSREHGDWTKIYSMCESYEDVEDLTASYDSESKRLASLSDSAMLSAHQHDHAEVCPDTTTTLHNIIHFI
jgi:hypothetical protein